MNTQIKEEVQPKQNIKDIMQDGVQYRESGDYDAGEKLLSNAFRLSKEAGINELVIESGNQIAIQYRLSAGRAARQKDTALAREYSLKALNIYKELEQLGLLDPNHFATQRNYSHTLLYSGFINQAIVELEKSVEVQPNEALKGDEMCHLASTYTDEENLDLDKAYRLVETGIHLLEDNDGSPIALTYALMTKATILSLRGAYDEATNTLVQASETAIARDLKVRQEEIQYLQTLEPKEINVLEVVSGELRNERRTQKYER